MTIELDRYGCIKHLNEAAKAFNHQLRLLCIQLRSELKNAVIVYVDIYGIKFHFIANTPYYGFKNPFLACCGHGGPPCNYNPNITCGKLVSMCVKKGQGS
ncbi:SGNH hydrolase-type esterase domain containing protein [Parasponia andersonii]|uniref:SGNH hydrolase-type esterase domain containing protein n=1 Tax=Parasponia andersonii TaxID=3476 RepID=A0A2P5CLC7_PARAD|nr:SGNH hydrolase-type esterase domain containing protein [Parasponia andersonii]